MGSENHVEFRLKTTEKIIEFDKRKVSEINRQIRNDLVAAEKFPENELN